MLVMRIRQLIIAQRQGKPGIRRITHGYYDAGGLTFEIASLFGPAAG